MERGDSERPAVPWKVRDVVQGTGLLLAGLLIILVIVGLIASVAGIEESTLLTPWFTGALEGLMLVAVWAVAVKKRGAGWRALGLRRPEGPWNSVLPWATLLSSLAFTGIYVGAVKQLGFDSLFPPPVPEGLLGGGAILLLNALVIVVWGPFVEEVFFRGFVFAGLLRTLGGAGAAAASAAVFAAAHVSVSTMIPMFVTGLLLAWLYYRTRSIWPPVVAHAAQNLITLSFMA